MKISKLGKYCAGAAFVAMSVSAFAAPQASTPLTAIQLLKSAQNRVTTPEETAKVKFKINEADGSSKIRELVIKRKSGAKEYVLARLIGSSDLDGTSFLSIYSSGHEDQWLYLPSSKQTRRIVGGNRQAGFLGSEITYEDLSASQAQGARVSWERTDLIAGHKYAVIVVRPRTRGGAYSKVVSWISLDQDLVLKAQYFDWRNRPVKLVNFYNYRRYGYDVWRAQLVRVKNLVNHRSTDLILEKLDVGQKISDSEFSVHNLEVD